MMVIVPGLRAFGKIFSEVLLMIEGDRRYPDRVCTGDCGGIEPSAQSGFQNREANTSFTKPEERNGGYVFKKSR